MNILQKNIEFNKFLVDFINILNFECENGAVVLVEGKKDTQALSSLGFVGKTIEYCNNNNIFTTISLADNASDFLNVERFDLN